jgi:hypothetical protein
VDGDHARSRAAAVERALRPAQDFDAVDVVAAADAAVEVTLPPAPALDCTPRMVRPEAGLSVPRPWMVVLTPLAAPPLMPGTSSRMSLSW